MTVSIACSVVLKAHPDWKKIVNITIRALHNNPAQAGKNIGKTKKSEDGLKKCKKSEAEQVKDASDVQKKVKNKNASKKDKSKPKKTCFPSPSNLEASDIDNALEPDFGSVQLLEVAASNSKPKAKSSNSDFNNMSDGQLGKALDNELLQLVDSEAMTVDSSDEDDIDIVYDDHSSNSIPPLSETSRSTKSLALLDNDSDSDNVAPLRIEIPNLLDAAQPPLLGHRRPTCTLTLAIPNLQPRVGFTPALYRDGGKGSRNSQGRPEKWEIHQHRTTYSNAGQAYPLQDDLRQGKMSPPDIG
ncbi:hypothetical protein BDN70DRAFT_900346 [Pholiota conissans]|uniref:Uncharacterized protein n=1 Tax=Pholiota conissans TaxID=109636 RepID=A0A9P5YS59_9AGAR|nr:hypothetical protein BDN70DRAFT_900346 [Pholiota conissans]